MSAIFTRAREYPNVSQPLTVDKADRVPAYTKTVVAKNSTRLSRIRRLLLDVSSGGAVFMMLIMEAMVVEIRDR